MCRMVGVVFRGQFPSNVLTDLRTVSREGKIPDREQRGHRDGWGIASFVDGSPQYLERSRKWASDDTRFEIAISKASKLRPPNIVIGHVRAASRGKAKLANTHPFIVGGIVLGHNGTIKRFDPVTSRKPKGETDSELFALAVLDRYEKERDLGEALRSAILEEVLDREFTGAVFLASDGNELCGYRDYSIKGQYYDLRLATSDDSVVLFQETASGMVGSTSQVKRSELVTIDTDLRIERKTVR